MSSFKKVALVIFFATVSYAVTSIYITQNLVQYSTLPSTIQLSIHNEVLNKTVPIRLPVSSALPIDTVDKKGIQNWIKQAGSDILYHQNPVFLVWSLFICMMISIAAGSAPVFISHIIELKQRFSFKNYKYPAIATLCSMFILIFLSLRNFNLNGYIPPPQIINDFHILLKDGYILQNIVLTTLLFVMPALSLIFLIPFCLPTVTKDNCTIAHLKNVLNDLDFLHQKLQGVLQVLSIIVVFSVLTSTALGDAIRSTLIVKGFNLYPKEVSYVYGIFFSFFLCILYIPVYFFMKQHYNTVKEKALSPINCTQAEQKVFYENNFKDSKFQNTSLDNLKLALTVFAPLISGFLPGIMDAIH